MSAQYRNLGDHIQQATLFGDYDRELILVRHGQQIPFGDRKPEDRADPPLTELGERQAAAVAAALAAEGIGQVVTSTLQRARNTGAAIAAQHDLNITEVHDLREIELVRDLPDGKAPWDVIDETLWHGAGAEFVRTGRWESFPFSEPSAEFRRRVCRAVEGVLATADADRVVIACHGGVINCYIAEMLGLDRDFFFRPAHCSVHRLFVSGTRRVIWNLNETHHLPGDLLTA